MPDNARDTTDDEYQFTCPECAQEIAVNGEMREAILTHGCPVCAADVTAEQFE
jgi:predicted nucleic acid-binding Zn ribbon protein